MNSAMEIDQSIFNSDFIDKLVQQAVATILNQIYEEDFLDNLDHSWLIKFVEHRVADPRILRLIQKWLKAGVMEEGKWSEAKAGSPQGSVISPLLANIYLHYTFDLWVNVWRRKYAQGEVVVIRFADDTIAGFQYQTDADHFLENLRERLEKFGLELHPDKAGLSSVGLPNKTGNEEGKASRKRSTF
jgi:RNA-directed DNA polymerase